MTTYRLISIFLSLYTLVTGIIGFVFHRMIRRAIIDMKNSRDISDLEENNRRLEEKNKKIGENINKIEDKINEINTTLLNNFNLLKNQGICLERMKSDMDKYKTSLDKLKIDFEKYLSQNNERQKSCVKSFDDIEENMKELETRLRMDEQERLRQQNEIKSIISSDIKNLIKEITRENKDEN